MKLNVFQTKDGKVTFMANSNIPPSHYEGEKIGTLVIDIKPEKKLVTKENEIDNGSLYNMELIDCGIIPREAINVKITYEVEE
jgi:hypothetical protein